jgi:deoxyribodipyrimidine photo-lyase
VAEKTATIVWFRRDFRLSDNPALRAAVELGNPIVPVFIFSPEEEKDWAPGGASRWWLHHSLISFSQSLKDKGVGLVIRRGKTVEVLDELIKEAGAKAVFWNRLYEPEIIKRDTKVKEHLGKLGIEAHSFNGALLKEPSTFSNQAKKPFQVFTPFWNALEKILDPALPSGEPERLAGISKKLDSLKISDLNLLPKIKWDSKFYEVWKPGEKNAQKVLDTFLKASVDDYSTGRDIPSIRGTSHMSPYLHFGEISPNQVWHAVKKAGYSEGAKTYLREIGWREFAHHLLVHFPHTPNQPLRENFKNFRWEDDSEGLKAWQKGLTGYPIIDAGMRELWTTGWMHNRVRMIVSSFLVKDLLINWTEGANWFWDTLVDASLANNTLGWQWSGGCGADAAPFFRIFNPITQGEKFDKTGHYVRKWVPELTELPDKYLHKPWEAPEGILKLAKVELGKTYPTPIVDHSEARGRALRAFDRIKEKNLC